MPTACRLEQGTALRLPAPSLAAELFHFEWVMCDTCDKWRHLRLSPPEYWDVQLRSTWSCGARVGFDEYGASHPTKVRAEACAVPQVTWKTPVLVAAPPPPGATAGWPTAAATPMGAPPPRLEGGRRAAASGGGSAALSGAASGSGDAEAPTEGELNPVGVDAEPMRPVAWTPKEEAWLHTLVEEVITEAGGGRATAAADWTAIAQRLSTGRVPHKVQARWSLIEQREELRRCASDRKALETEPRALVAAAAAAATADAVAAAAPPVGTRAALSVAPGGHVGLKLHVSRGAFAAPPSGKSHHGPRYRHNKVHFKCQGIVAGKVRRTYNYRTSDRTVVPAPVPEPEPRPTSGPLSGIRKPKKKKKR